MEKKNRLITLKTFEEFKAENEQFYPFVLTALQNVLTFINTHGIKREGQFNMVNAGSWKIEGSVHLTDLDENPNVNKLMDIILHSTETPDDSIHIVFNASSDIKTNTPGDHDTPPDFESDKNIEIDTITYYKDTDYSIKLTNEIVDVAENIIYKIAQ